MGHCTSVKAFGSLAKSSNLDEEDPASPQHPARVGCRDEAGLSSIASSLGAIQGKVVDAFASLLLIHNVCHSHGRPDCHSSETINKVR